MDNQTEIGMYALYYTIRYIYVRSEADEMASLV